MNTDPSSIDSATSLLNALQLGSTRFHDCALDSFLPAVWECVNEIWSMPDDYNYTDHGIHHSKEIIAYFLKFDETYHWSKYERLIFAVSALVHDLGMQFNLWQPSIRIAELPQSPLPIGEVRKQHVKALHYLMNALLEDKKPQPAFPRQIWVTNGERSALWNALRIAEAHSGIEFLKLLTNGAPNAPRKMEHCEFRPRLLAGILRICDEFDGDYRRIRIPGRIWAADLNDESRRHWFSCLWVESSNLEVHEHTWKLRIQWRVPVGASSDLVRKVRSLLDAMRERKIRNEIACVDSFYDSCSDEDNKRSSEVELAKEPTLFPFDVNTDLENFMEVALAQKGDLGRSVYGIQNDDTICQKSTDARIADVTQSFPVKRTTLLENLEYWFQENRKCGHFELVNGDHTDTYLNCRTLVSNNSLLLDIAGHLYTELRQKGYSFSCVVAVGTSAIPLAVNLCLRFGCAANFTVHPIDGYGRKKYSPMEVEPCVQPRSHILIVDDVISGGRVAHQVNEQLLRYEPEMVVHRAIFRLGLRSYIQHPKIRDYSWLLHVQDVNYYDKGNCILCASSPPTREEDMH